MVTQNISRSIQRNGPEIGGGVVGVGAPVALREFADVRNGEEVSLIDGQGEILSRLTRPSVAWGLGAGGLTGLLWAMDVGPRWLQDFYLTHAITGIPTGVGSALMPVEAGSTSTSAMSRLQSMMGNGQATQDGGSDGEFAPAGGSSTETQPAQ